jgi:hypothetical protein
LRSSFLYGLGAAGGLVIALWSSRIWFSSSQRRATQSFSICPLMAVLLAFTIAVTCAHDAAVWQRTRVSRAARVAPIEALKRRGRTVQGQVPAALSGSLIVVQVALSLILALCCWIVRPLVRVAHRAFTGIRTGKGRHRHHQ